MGTAQLDVTRKQVGRHTVEIEGDILIVRLVGDFSLDDLKAYYQIAGDMKVGGPIYNIADLRQAGSISAEARRYAVVTGHERRFGITVAFGLNPVMRVTLVLLVRAARLLQPRHGNVELEFVENEAAARALIASRRQAAVSSGGNRALRGA
jgi:hypothetical protein